VPLPGPDTATARSIAARYGGAPGTARAGHARPAPAPAAAPAPATTPAADARPAGPSGQAGRSS
jgi:hypothetical protein